MSKIKLSPNERRELMILRALKRKASRKRLKDFTEYTKKDYDTQWFHDIVCFYLDKLARREIKKLMIFMPPQHGKSELSSRRFPAYLFGINPKERLILGSYNLTKASEFVTDCKRIIQTPEYTELFPETRIQGSDRNDYFEVNYKGFLKGAGMDSGVTGTTADGIIIDDPFKGRNEANSKTFRDRIWRTYSDDFQTRLHNNSFQLMLFTRWHDDDPAGRILNPESEYYDAKEAKEWTVLTFQAIKELGNPPHCNVVYHDPREVGEALWESQHSREKYEKRKRINPTGFASLDQQRPSAQGGNKILKEWFKIVNARELPFNPQSVRFDFYIDGAYTENTKNDETGLLAMHFHKQTDTLYIYNCIGIRKELSKFLKYFPEYAKINYRSRSSVVNIEPKASGKSMSSMLKTQQYGNFNVREISSKWVSIGKWNRVEQCEPFLASGKVVLVKGTWNERFLQQAASFPNAVNDDMVDVMAYAILDSFLTNQNSQWGSSALY